MLLLLLFIVQLKTQASKSEQLKQNKHEEYKKRVKKI